MAQKFLSGVNIISSGTGSLTLNGGTGVSTTGAFILRQNGDGSDNGIAITSSHATSHRIWKDSSGSLNIGPSSDADAFRLDTSGNAFIDGKLKVGDLDSATNILHVNSATADTIARFSSGDNLAKIIVEDDDTQAIIGASGNIAFFGPDGGTSATENIRLDNRTGRANGGYGAYGATPSEAYKFRLGAGTLNTSTDANYTGMFVDIHGTGTASLTTDRYLRGIHVDVDSDATGGNTSDELRIYGGEFNVKDTGDADLLYGIYAFAENEKTSALDNVTQVAAVRAQANIDNTAGTVTNSHGVYGTVRAAGSGTKTNLYAGRFELSSGTSDSDITNVYGSYGKIVPGNGYTGTISTARGVYGEVEIATGNTFTNSWAVQAVVDHNGGTATTAAQFRGSSSGTIGTSYGIYSTGAAINRLDGQLSVNTSASPTHDLTVGGDIRLTGNSIFDDGTIVSDGTNFGFDGASGKEVYISSARDIRLIIDDNNDDTTTDFNIYKHSVASGNELLTIDQSGNTTISGTLSVDGDQFTLGDGTYETVLFDTSPSSIIGNGTMEVQPTTSPGSGTANFTSYFKDKTGGGTTKHHIKADGNITANAFYGDGSNLTNITVSNADTVDNVHASSFLRSDQSDTGTGTITLADSSAADNPLILGSSSQTSYTLQQWQTSAHGTNEAYILAYGAGHGSQAGNFAMKNIESGGEIFFELAGGVEPLRMTSTASTFEGKVGAGLNPSTSLHVSGSALTNNVAAYIGGGWVGNDSYHKEGGLLVISGTNTSQTGAGIAFQTRNTANTNYHKSSMIMDRDGAISFELGGQGTGATSEKLKITAGGDATFAGDVTVEGGELYIGKADTASGHLNAYELMTFNIDTDNDDTNRYFGFFVNGASGSGTELFKIEETGLATFTTSTSSIANGSPQIKATHGYQTLRLHHGSGSGFDLLAYSGQHLWTIGNSTFSEIVLASSWSWDNQIGIRYTPGSAGQYSGVLAIGQLTGEKNNSEYTHGLTRFYNRGVQSLELHHDGAVIKGNNSDASKLNFQIGHEGFQLLDSYDYKDGVRSNMTGLEIRTNNLTNANSNYPDLTVSALGRTTTSSGEGVIRIKNRRKYRKLRGYLKLRAGGSTDGWRDSSQAISGTTFMDGVAITGFDNAGSNETWIWGVVANNYDANEAASNKPSFVGNNYSKFLNNYVGGSQGDSPWTYWWNYADTTGRPPVIIVTFERDFGTTQLDGDIEIRVMSDQGKGNEDTGIEQYAIWLGEEDEDYQRVDGSHNGTDAVTKHVIGPHPHGQARVGQLHIKQTQDSSVTGGDGIAIVRSNTNDDIGYLNMTGGAFNMISTGATPIKLRSGNGTTALTLDTSQNAEIAGNLTVSGTGLSTIAGQLYVGQTTDYFGSSTNIQLNSGSSSKYVGIRSDILYLYSYNDGSTSQIIFGDGNANFGLFSNDTNFRLYNYNTASAGITVTRSDNQVEFAGKLLTPQGYESTSGVYTGGGTHTNKWQKVLSVPYSSNMFGYSGFNLDIMHIGETSGKGAHASIYIQYKFQSNNGRLNANIINYGETEIDADHIAIRRDHSNLRIELYHKITTSYTSPRYLVKQNSTTITWYNTVTGDDTALGNTTDDGFTELNITNGFSSNPQNGAASFKGDVEIHNEGNDTTGKLTIAGNNNTGTPGQKTSGTIEHRGADLKTVITHNGSDVITIGTGTDTTLAGELYLPSYVRHTGDDDTYFGFSGANSFKVRSGGVDRLSVTGDVNVNSTTDLNINGTSRRINFTAGTGTVRTTTANNLYLAANSTTVLELKSDQTADFTSNVKVGAGIGAYETQSIVSQSGQRTLIPKNSRKFLGNSSTGAIAITSPLGSTDSMYTIKGTIFEYNYQESFEFVVSGYYWNGTWYNTTAYIVGHAQSSTYDRNFTVRFGRDGSSKPIVYIGETDSTWNYCYVYINEINYGWTISAADMESYLDGWTISGGNTSFSNEQSGVRRENCLITNWSRNGSKVYYNLGYVGIGNDDPSSPLHVSGTGTQARFQSSSSYSDILFTNSAGTAGFLNFGSTTAFNVYVGGGSASNLEMSLSNTGNLTVSGDVVAYGSPSDIRLKENIKPVEKALDKVIKLNGVSFDWKDKEDALDREGNPVKLKKWKKDIGFIAQEVQEVIPELVRENEEGMLSVRHQGIIPILVESIKELKQEIEQLKKQIKNG